MEDKNSVAEFWKEYKSDFAGDVLAPEIISLSKKYIGKSVLDAGAGSGALINRIPNAIGIDLAPKSPKIIKGDISKMPFENGRFDTVFATEVIEHLSKDVLEGGLKEISRVLKPRGTFIITLPYREDINKDVVVCPKCGEKFHRWGHLQSFDEEKAKNILESRGFKIISMRALPLASMVRHPFLKYFRWFLQKLGHFNPTNFLIISEKY